MSMDGRRTGNKSYEILEVTDHQKEIARMLALGRPTEEIAEALGVHRQTISNVRNHPIIIEMIRALHESRNDRTKDITEQIAEVAPDAIRLLKTVITQDEGEPRKGLAGAPDVSDQIRASLGILRTITPRINLHAHKHLITSQKIEQIKKRALEGAQKVKEEDYEEISSNSSV